MKEKRIKTCAICNKIIDNSTKYCVFKRNEIFNMNNSKWFGLTKHFICQECMESFKNYSISKKNT